MPARLQACASRPRSGVWRRCANPWFRASAGSRGARGRGFHKKTRGGAARASTGSARPEPAEGRIRTGDGGLAGPSGERKHPKNWNAPAPRRVRISRSGSIKGRHLIDGVVYRKSAIRWPPRRRGGGARGPMCWLPGVGSGAGVAGSSDAREEGEFIAEIVLRSVRVCRKMRDILNFIPATATVFFRQQDPRH